MSPATSPTLAGSPAATLHLSEYTLGTVDNALPPLQPQAAGENFLLLFSLGGPALRCRTLDLGWHLAPDHLVWLRHLAPAHLRSSSLRPARLLAWRFTAAALPAELAEILLALPPTPAILSGPRPLHRAEAALVLGLRSCPVAPALRSLWAGAKLVEFLTHLLPAPKSSATHPDPTSASGLPAPVRTALAYMDAHLAAPIGLTELAAAAAQSPAHFSRTFSEALGHGPTAHLRQLRMQHAARLLAAGHANVTEAALAVGYQSLGQFSRVFNEHHGRPPSAFLPRKNA
ncbi:MAG: helix-turn-helix transcriptional regulator [Verrucomicrobia bacterium]|nr:helix-turn-helix transcriptional regulator [Verrucomicrobiota bacterium]